jgi:hypothetical protein
LVITGLFSRKGEIGNYWLLSRKGEIGYYWLVIQKRRDWYLLVSYPEKVRLVITG